MEEEQEVEIKLLGDKKSLTKVFRNFMKELPNSLRDRHYSFNTYYLDTPSFDLARRGFSLRHRSGVFSIGKQAGTELKALHGHDSINKEISVRKELGVRGCHALVNFERLQTKEPELLSDIKTSDLQIQFATAVRRLERRSLTSFGVVLEAALDDMEILLKEGESKGKDLYDVLLFPIKTEHELEFELKGKYHATQLPLSLDLVKTKCVKDEPVLLTTDSKASRVLKLIL